ncbi:Lead, cadmium, zinc and mercury transporting ATPase; Copper-translocating P-type ATPase, partial [hydrothermal vent metagenome]
AMSAQIPPAKVLQFEALTGAGALGILGGVTWYIGNPALFLGMGISLDIVSEQINALQSSGKTVVLIGTEKNVYGMIALQDQLRSESFDAIDKLHKMGIKIAMLTGDNVLTANAVARPLGIDDLRAGLKPEEKVEAIKDLEKSYGPVLMVGDGVNDAPALAAATCGASMGVAGSDAAIEAADVALMADDLTKVEEALRLGRVARQISKQNIVFSLIVLALLIPSALGGFLSVAAVVFFHEASELLAVANGLRVARKT